MVAAAATVERLAVVPPAGPDGEVGDRYDALLPAARGRVAGARHEIPAAVAALEAAAGRFTELALPFEAARTQLDLGRVLAPSDPDLAIAHARRALGAFEQLGATFDADGTAAFLRGMGVVARVGPKGIGTLTAREQDVLRLLAAGFSNPEIGVRLQMSRKTAAHHVSNILSKLELRNRAQAAAYAAALEGSGRPGG